MSTQQDLLIERLLAGEIDMNNRELRLACANPDFAQRLDETLRLREGLDEAAVLAEARADQASGSRPNLLDQRLDSLVRQKLAPAPRRRWLKPLLATAAAACLLLAWQPFGGAAEREIPQVFLGGGKSALRCIPQSESRAEFGSFDWDNLHENGLCTLEIKGPDGVLLPGGRVELPGDARGHTADPVDVAAWPDEIIWSVAWVAYFGGDETKVYGAASRHSD